MKIGEYIKTPRFGEVKIKAMFFDKVEAWNSGYTEPTNFRDSEYFVRGKHIGENRMIFAAIAR